VKKIGLNVLLEFRSRKFRLEFSKEDFNEIVDARINVLIKTGEVEDDLASILWATLSICC
jgi:hypothetical protein